MTAENRLLKITLKVAAQFQLIILLLDPLLIAVFTHVHLLDLITHRGIGMHEA